MRNRFPLRALFCLFLCVGTASAQESSDQDKVKVVLIPRDVGLVTVAYQPDCPLQFEDVSWVAAVTGGAAPSYELRNRSLKPIRWVKIGDTTGSTWSWDVARYRAPVPPGELVPSAGGSGTQIVPLTDELRAKLKLQQPMRYLLVLMVIRVEFTDGTVYDDEKVFKALVAHMDDLQAKLNMLEALKNKSK